MNRSLRRLLDEAAMPLVCASLAILFIALQFFAAPQTLGHLQSLAPAETSSPRATVEGFRNNTSRAATLLMEAYRQNKSEPGWSWSPSVTEKVAEADAMLARASRTFDFSEVPPVELEHRTLEATLLLKEILDRVPLPDSNTIPGDAEVKAQPVSGWSVPGTQIRIVRVSDGPRAGEYLFSKDTVRQLDDFYQAVRRQPNLDGSTEDFYDFFSQSPGHLLPPKWFGLIEALPPVLRIEILGQAAWQWISLGIISCLAGLAVLGIYRLARRTPNVETAVPLIASMVPPAAVAVAALFVGYVSDSQINLTGRVNDIAAEVAQGIVYLAIIWGILTFSNALADRFTLFGSKSIDAHLARAAIRISGLAIALVLLVYGASYLGIPLAGVLAGLGVGGLAVALAAKPTIENFIGGLILYADRPVRVGDLCRFGPLEGRVEEIGLRSTRIRGLDRTLITIPNATFVNMNIINLTNRDRMPYERIITLNADDSAMIRSEIDAFAALVAEHPMIEQGSVKTRLREGQEEKPKVEICALILTSKWDGFLQIQQEIDLLLRDRILASKSREEGVSPEADNVVQLGETA